MKTSRPSQIKKGHIKDDETKIFKHLFGDFNIICDWRREIIENLLSSFKNRPDPRPEGQGGLEKIVNIESHPYKNPTSARYIPTLEIPSIDIKYKKLGLVEKSYKSS